MGVDPPEVRVAGAIDSSGCFTFFYGRRTGSRIDISAIVPLCARRVFIQLFFLDRVPASNDYFAGSEGLVPYFTARVSPFI